MSADVTPEGLVERQWTGVISLDRLEASAKKKRDENSYSWIDPNHVLRLVEIARRTDYYKAQYDDLMESWAALQERLKKVEGAFDSISALSDQEALLDLIDRAHEPREHPDFPGAKAKRSDPTSYIEGYTTALLKVNSRIHVALAALNDSPSEGTPE